MYPYIFQQRADSCRTLAIIRPIIEYSSIRVFPSCMHHMDVTFITCERAATRLAIPVSRYTEAKLVFITPYLVNDRLQSITIYANFWSCVGRYITISSRYHQPVETRLQRLISKSLLLKTCGLVYASNDIGIQYKQ